MRCIASFILLGLPPDLPRCVAAFPKGLEADFVADGVHALPEAVVLISHELAVAGEMFERLALE